MKTFRGLCALFALLTAFTAPTYGQAVNATILGTVTDATGGSVANAKVTATETDTATSRSVQTNDSGNFTFPDIAPGTYSIAVEQAGFKKETRSGIVVNVNTSTRVDLQLQPGNVSESIEVTGAPPSLQTDRADIGAKLENIETENLPAGGQRNFQTLLNLVPGTTRATFQHSQFFNAASSLQTEVNGQPRMGNNYQLEGIDNNERTGLLQILVPPIEAIQNVDISTSNFEAELGRASGAVTNVMLKSGANGFTARRMNFCKTATLTRAVSSARRWARRTTTTSAETSADRSKEQAVLLRRLSSRLRIMRPIATRSRFRTAVADFRQSERVSDHDLRPRDG